MKNRWLFLIVFVWLAACSSSEDEGQTVPDEKDASVETDASMDAGALTDMDGPEDVGPSDADTSVDMPDQAPDSSMVLPPADARQVVVDGDSTFAEVVAGVAPGEWVQFETTAAQGYFNNGNGGHDLTWGDSAIYDETSGCLMHYGGGHITIPAFSIYCTRTNEWVRGPLPDWLDLEGNVWAYTNHGYDRNSFDPETRRLFYYRQKELWIFELGTETWSRHTLALGNAYLRDFATFVPGTGVVAGRGENDPRLFVIDPEDGSTTIDATSSFHSALHTFGEYSPIHDVLLYGGGDDQRSVYIRESNGDTRAVADAPEVIRTVAGGSTGGWALTDPDDGDFLVLSALTGELHRYDPASDMWSLESRSPFEPELSRTIAATITDHGVLLFATRAAGDRALITLYRPK